MVRLNLIDPNAVQILLNLTIKLDTTNHGRKGGFFVEYDGQQRLLEGCSFGTYPEEKLPKYLRAATDKVTRMIDNNEHRSRLSANKDLGHYGGGVQCGGIACAFSGFPWEEDEAISLVYAYYKVHSSRMDRKQFVNLVAEHFPDNDKILPLYDAFCDYILADIKNA